MPTSTSRRSPPSRARNEALQALLRRFAATHPRDGQYEATFRSFQEQARALARRDHALDREVEPQPA